MSKTRSGLRKCSISFILHPFSKISFIRPWILGYFWMSGALSHRAVRGLYSRRVNHKMPGVMTRSNWKGRWYHPFNQLGSCSYPDWPCSGNSGMVHSTIKKMMRGQTLIVLSLRGLQANDYILRILIIWRKLIRRMAGWEESLTSREDRNHLPFVLFCNLFWNDSSALPTAVPVSEKAGKNRLIRDWSGPDDTLGLWLSVLDVRQRNSACRR